MRTHLAQVPFTLDVFFCSRSLSLLTTFLSKGWCWRFYSVLCFSLSLIFTRCVCLCLSLTCMKVYTHERHNPIFFVSKNFHLFCFDFFSSHLIGESHIYNSNPSNHLNYSRRSSLKKNKKRRKKKKRPPRF